MCDSPKRSCSAAAPRRALPASALGPRVRGEALVTFPPRSPPASLAHGAPGAVMKLWAEHGTSGAIAPAKAPRWTKTGQKTLRAVLQRFSLLHALPHPTCSAACSCCDCVCVLLTERARHTPSVPPGPGRARAWACAGASPAAATRRSRRGVRMCVTIVLLPCPPKPAQTGPRASAPLALGFTRCAARRRLPPAAGVLLSSTMTWPAPAGPPPGEQCCAPPCSAPAAVPCAS